MSRGSKTQTFAGFWPYETFKDVKQLAGGIPPIEDFNTSIIRKRRLTEEEYQSFLEYCRENGITTLGDLLRDYNNRDVIGFSAGVEKLRQFWEEKGFDAFKGMISNSQELTSTAFLQQEDKLVWLVWLTATS
jgi:hypothetical protein